MMPAVVFRADASVYRGTGHVRRCLELASRLAACGAPVVFVCLEIPGNMIAEITARGFQATPLHAPSDGRSDTSLLSWEQDAEQTSAAIARTGFSPEWLVVDHYGLDSRWEGALRRYARRIMAIDDLADRAHDCEVLLDQNLANPRHARYAKLLPERARRLIGPQYALLAPGFARRRASALARRRGQLQRALVSMGGTDPGNDTARALDGLAMCARAGIALDVVVGAANPQRAALAERCAAVPDCELHVQTERMAELMERADLALTGAGSTTWERCVLGLPALAVVQSEDQSAIAEAVADAGAHRLLGRSADVRPADYAAALGALTPDLLESMSVAAAALCDGQGAERVAAVLTDGSDA